MRGTGASASPQVMRIIREPTDVRTATSRRWCRGVAFPWSKILDVVKADWCFDPLNHVFYANHPHIPLGKLVTQELLHGCKQEQYSFFLLKSIIKIQSISYLDVLSSLNNFPTTKYHILHWLY